MGAEALRPVPKAEEHHYAGGGPRCGRRLPPPLLHLVRNRRRRDEVDDESGKRRHNNRNTERKSSGEGGKLPLVSVKRRWGVGKRGVIVSVGLSARLFGLLGVGFVVW